MRRSTLSLLAVASLAVTACGRSSDSATSSVPAQTDVTTTIDTATADEPVDADESEAEMPLDDDAVTSGGSVEAIESDDINESVEPCVGDDCDEGADEPRIDDVTDEPPFVPDPDDAAFCEVVDTVGDEDLPSDEQAEALAVRDQVARVLEVAPGDLRDDLMVFDEFIGRVIAGEARLDDVEEDPFVEAAGTRIGYAIAQRCDGVGIDTTNVDPPEDPDVPVADPVDPIDSADDPPLPDGVTIPNVPIENGTRDDQYPFFGERADDGGPAEPTPGFIPAEDDAGFCTALDIINNRPQPSDDFEEITVAQQYLVAISPLVPDAIRTDFVTLLDWVDLLVENGSFDGIEEPGDGNDLDVSIEAIDEFVNVKCLGR